MNEDIGNILRDWKFNQDEIANVRLIDGVDGHKKIQLRIDMGIIQMEMDNNPSGEKVGDFESWLEYYEDKQKKFEDSKVDDYFSLNSEECRNLETEAVRYYYRYFSLMKLDDYKRVIRDTERNLRVLKFVKKYASSELDSWELNQFKPYIIMMNTRAKISLMLSDKSDYAVENAVELCDMGIPAIKNFFKEYNIEDERENSAEITILKTLKDELTGIMPESLEKKLLKAVEDERYEDAAFIRDEIRKKKGKKEINN
jgi:hypothetical protein